LLRFVTEFTQDSLPGAVLEGVTNVLLRNLHAMSLYLKELNDLEGVLSLAHSIEQNEWAACLDYLRSLPASQGETICQLLRLLEQMGAKHLAAVRDSMKRERAKGCIPAYFRELSPV